jgi:hypothetical protein
MRRLEGHGLSLAFDPKMFVIRTEIVANFGHHFITPLSTDVSGHNITGIPRICPETALDAVANLTTFQMGLSVGCAAAQ